VRFLADENFPGAAVKALRLQGHVVDWVHEIAPGVADEQVLARAIQDGAVILTFDKDFGELARSTKLPDTCGIILFRMQTPKAATVGAELARIVGSRNDLAGHHTVVEPTRLRMRPFVKIFE